MPTVFTRRGRHSFFPFSFSLQFNLDFAPKNFIKEGGVCRDEVGRGNGLTFVAPVEYQLLGKGVSQMFASGQVQVVLEMLGLQKALEAGYLSESGGGVKITRRGCDFLLQNNLLPTQGRTFQIPAGGAGAKSSDWTF